MDDEIDELFLLYNETEEKILRKIEKLSSYGNDCDCENIERFTIVNVYNTYSYCLNCGGYLELL